MSHKKDTDYLSISARVRAMENRLLTGERLERMIDARDDAEALKVLSECGYGELSVLTAAGLERLLGDARAAMFRELAAAVPDPALMDMFRLKYDYHNAKVLVKAEAIGEQVQPLLVDAGRYAPDMLLQGLQDCSEDFRDAVSRARTCMEQTGDPQQADILLDRAYFAEMTKLAKECAGTFLQDYVRLMVDAANLRTCVRCARLEKDRDFMSRVLIEGGSVSAADLVGSWGQDFERHFRSGPLERAAELAAGLAKPNAGPLTAFERECDDALMNFQQRCRRSPFGEDVVVGYLLAREAELTATRTVMAGRMAGLDGEVIRRRLRRTYV